MKRSELKRSLNKDEKINAVFVDQAYKTFLRRSPSSEELSERLASGMLKSELFQELWNSAELRSIIDEAESKNDELLVTREEVSRAYFVFLGRSPSGDELSERATSGVSKIELFEELWASEELRYKLKNKVLEPSVTKENVYKAYEVFFNRVPSSDEVEERVSSGITTTELLRELWDSEELNALRNRKEREAATREDIQKTYEIFLRRVPTEEEITQRISSGICKEDLLEELWNSEEIACQLRIIKEREAATREDIQKTYEIFLRRVPTEEEITQRISSGICKEDLLEELWNSEEIACQLRRIKEREAATREDIQKAYEVFFRRTPTEEELNQRLTSGIFKAYLIEELWNSEELVVAMDRASLKSNRNLERTDVDKNIKELLKKTLENKWKLADFIDSSQTISSLSCNICGYEDSKGKFGILNTECAFGGGYLERFKCPKCGCIFGPVKILKLTPEELEEEYKVHYSIYNEGDCTEKELMTFFSLEPDKKKRYLNFGCGIWADTIDILRDKGFDVWGYEPFADAAPNPYIITDFNKLQSMKFDGIFSNDLLEHLADPTAYFTIFKDLLEDSESKMAHSTGCYKYLYEKTRFHLFFYTGDSVEILAQKTGFEVASYQEDKNIDYYNYVYKVKER
ncbi:MAG: class I SAM-dependent methyltransferase [Desulfitobacterium sp.]